MAYQVSIFLENKIGHLERVTAVLKAAEINIRTMNLNHTANGWGILNLVVSNPELAHSLLIENGLSAALREIVVIEMIDQPGGLDDLLKGIVKCRMSISPMLMAVRDMQARRPTLLSIPTMWPMPKKN